MEQAAELLRELPLVELFEAGAELRAVEPRVPADGAGVYLVRVVRGQAGGGQQLRALGLEGEVLALQPLYALTGLGPSLSL